MFKPWLVGNQQYTRQAETVTMENHTPNSKQQRQLRSHLDRKTLWVESAITRDRLTLSNQQGKSTEQSDR